MMHNKPGWWLRVIAMAGIGMLATPQSWAWGREGHRLTALVAEQFLTPHTRAAVAELLGNESMAGVSTWADEYRSQNPATGPWHYADTPLSATTYNRERDCPANRADPASPWRDCVVDRILYFELQLSDRSLPHEQRYQALKYLIHFVGDIHQPFHVLGDGRGGNDNRVSFLGSNQCGSYNCELHGIWDDDMIAHEHLSEPKFTAMLLDDIKQHDWQRLAGGTPVQWANASHAYAKLAWAPNGALIDTAYVNEETRVVNAQLALGGLRLARVLNTILSGERVPPFPDDAKPNPATQKAPAQ